MAKDRVGQLLSYLLAERYRNIELVEKIKCPCLIIHGRNDTLIDVSHSLALKSHCGSKVCQLVTPDNMDHNSFNMATDIIGPMKSFFRDLAIKSSHVSDSTSAFIVQPLMFQVPISIFCRDLSKPNLHNLKKQYKLLG